MTAGVPQGSTAEGSEASIRLAAAGDLGKLAAALRALAKDLGDPYRAEDEKLGEALFGTDPVAFAHLALFPGNVVGAVLASPVFSTMAGAAGVYVSDLWVASEHRGNALGQRLLASAAREGATRWGARFLKLSVYTDNPRAMAFYERLGFVSRERERSAVLDGAPFAAFVAGVPQ